MLVDWTFCFFFSKFKSIGIIGAICGVSLVINFLALPLYIIADSLQEKERVISKSLAYRVKRIKQAFKGDERFMMLQTYYRQNNYTPLSVLRSSLSILIEIPFFIAAYHYLSNCEALKGASFWIFKDLGSPDELFSIGSFSIHILPIIMTLINSISGAIYTKDAPLKEKIQLYVMALIFLVLLYNSPSGLVLYWILNNLFSLVKNIVMETKNPKKILHIVISTLLLFTSFCFFIKKGLLYKKIILLSVSVFVTLFPILKEKLAVYITSPNSTQIKKSNIGILIFSGLGLALLCGLYLPSNVISTSPIEFSFLGKTDSPVLYIKTSLLSFSGLFIFWPICIYFMFGNNVKKIEPALFFVLFMTALSNVFIFKTNLGTFDISFTLEDISVLKSSAALKIIPIIISVVIFLIYFYLDKSKKIFIASFLMIAVCCSEFLISFSKIRAIKQSFNEYSENSKDTRLENQNKIESIYHLSKNKKNVIVLFLDRAINSFFPYALKELPELCTQFQGFVYYPNTLSFSNNTTTAAPALMGGYEYTPDNLNKRSDELLQKKHNEASLVMPLLFTEAGFKVTVSDPPLPNYKYKGDLSAFKSHNIDAVEIAGKYSSLFYKTKYASEGVQWDSVVKKEIKNFSILQILYPLLRDIFYGNCRRVPFSPNYINQLSSLYYLPELTDFNSEDANFIFIENDTTHEPTDLDNNFLLPSPDKQSDFAYCTHNTITSRHYQVFVAAFKQIGKWLDYLKANEAYNNTRIIIVSDHGRQIELSEFSKFENSEMPGNYTPILLAKDFNSTSELAINNDFMTNADTLFIAKEGLPLSNVNPFTGKTFLQEKEKGISVYPRKEGEQNVENIIDKTQFTFDKFESWHVSDTIFEESNWIPLTKYETNSLTEGDEK